jgi:carbonic anhydrase/acetyltransferase-like protein (isoleucine patch superfamily)
MTVLLGYGSHGRDIEEMFRRRFAANIDRYDDDASLGLPPIPDSCAGRDGFIGINDPSSRRQLAERVGLCEGAALVTDQQMASVQAIGSCSVIAPMVLALVGVVIGAHSHVNYGASMTRCTIGDFVTISPGATICGDVVIGDETLIGANATVCDRSIIGKRCTIGAGAIIPPESVIPDDTTVVGVWKAAA